MERPRADDAMAQVAFSRAHTRSNEESSPTVPLYAHYPERISQAKQWAETEFAVSFPLADVLIRLMCFPGVRLAEFRRSATHFDFLSLRCRIAARARKPAQVSKVGTESVGRRPVRFGAFEVDLHTGELRKEGVVTHLSPQPCKILTLLVSHPGELVTREEIHEKVWGNETFVDFENGLNFAIKRIRAVLRDDAESPRYIETLPRRGYRFIAPIDQVNAAPPAVGTAEPPGSVLETSVASTKAESPPPATRPSSVVTPGASAPVPAARDPSAQKRRLTALAATAVTGIAVAAAGWFWHGRPRLTAPEEPLISVPLTSYAGHQDSPSFSPDGTQVAFTWDGEKEDNSDIYVKVIGSDPPLRLTTDPAQDFSPAWSPDGRWIAFCRATSGGRYAVVLIPPIGGRERILTEGFDNKNFPADPPYLAWYPDSRWLAVVGAEKFHDKPTLSVISLESGEKRELLPTSVSLWNVSGPAFSPDGRTLAFVAWSGPINRDIYLLGLTPGLKPVAAPRRLTSGNWMVASTAWAQDGGSLIFSNYDPTETTSLWRVDASGSGRPQRLPLLDANGTHPAISRRGNFLAYVQTLKHVSIWRIGVPTAGGKASTPRKFIASTRTDYFPRFSPDGKKISFCSDRSGSMEIWLCDSDGSHPFQLTSLGGPSISTPEWSPDGRHLTFELDSGEHHGVYVVDTNGGSPKRLTSMSSSSDNPSWSRDGRSIFFNNGSPDEPGAIFKIPAEGGSAVIVTNKAGWEPIESPDGRFIYSVGDSVDSAALLRTPKLSGVTQTVIPSGMDPFSYVVVEDGIYFISTPRQDSGYSIQFLNFTTGKTHRIAAFKNEIWGSLAVSPDRRWILYSQTDETGSDLMLVKNFR